MKFLIAVIVGILFVGCMSVKKGDYVTYTSDEYLFIHDNFIDQSLDCIELGSRQKGLDVKYCVGYNYASHLVQGFMFKHEYANNSERYLGSTLTFTRKREYRISCTSETIAKAESGTEYVNCMTSQRDFDMYRFIMTSKEDINGKFKAAIGNGHTYNGVINNEGKARLKQFYKDVRERNTDKWKHRSL